MSRLTLEELARIGKALSDPIRLKILDLIVRGRADACCPPPMDCCPEGLCVCDVQDVLQMAQSKVSYHIAELKAAGLLNEERRSKWTFYTINADMLRRYRDEVQRRFIEGEFAGAEHLTVVSD